jgi:hypothetical protein
MKSYFHPDCLIESCSKDGPYKCKLIGAIHQPCTFELDGYKVYQAENVSKLIAVDLDNYGVDRINFGWDILCSKEPLEGDVEYYFCVDGVYDTAFAHWIFESAYLLPLFLKLKKMIPSLKLYEFAKRKYKSSMYKAFGIDEKDIVSTIENPRNIFFFPKHGSLADHSDVAEFMRDIRIFYDSLVSKTKNQQKDIDILYLPRGTLENFPGNDRKVQFQENLMEFVRSQPNSLVYMTDTTENMIDQIEMVRRAKVILLDYGSNFEYNGFFAEESRIVVLGNMGNADLHLRNPRPAQKFFDTIKKKHNTYYFVRDMLPFEQLQIFIRYIADGVDIEYFKYKLDESVVQCPNMQWCFKSGVPRRH